MILLCYLFLKKLIDRHLQYEERHNKHLSCQSIEQIKRLIIFNPKNKERKKLTSKWSHTNTHSRSRDETLPSGLKFQFGDFRKLYQPTLQFPYILKINQLIYILYWHVHENPKTDGLILHSDPNIYCSKYPLNH